jgi:dihydropteroate synthase type 2
MQVHILDCHGLLGYDMVFGLNQMGKTKIAGIVNVTQDSFSDGGQYLDPTSAIKKSQELMAQGADLIDLGAESSRPEGQKVSAQEEIHRLSPIIKALKQQKVTLSVDTYKPEVIRHVLNMGVDMINDITALQEPASIEAVKEFGVPVVIMHSKSPGPHADRTVRDHRRLMGDIIRFFAERIDSLIQAGLKLENILIDPGMGFFLGGNPAPSLTVLKNLGQFKKLGIKIYLSTSRKSFIGTVLHRDVSKRSAGTLATEIWASLQGVDYIRTHDVEPLRDALTMLEAIQEIK